MITINQSSLIRSHWFFLIAPVVVAFDLVAAKFVGWSEYRSLEAALLFDFAVQLPLLYVWCYWRFGKQTIVRAVAMSCFSIWLVGKIVPADHQLILSSVSWLKYVGLVGLVVIEIKVIFFAWKSIFSGKSTIDTASKELTAEGMPDWVSKLIAYEGMFWKRAWSFVRRFFGRD